jgi:hypothetical protein
MLKFRDPKFVDGNAATTPARARRVRPPLVRLCFAQIYSIGVGKPGRGGSCSSRGVHRIDIVHFSPCERILAGWPSAAGVSFQM